VSDRPPVRTSERAVGMCRVCGEAFDRRRYKDGKVVSIDASRQHCSSHLWSRCTEEPVVDKITPYQHDLAAQLFVATFRGGATLDSIAEAIGVSRERVRQIEVEAKEKLRALGVGAFGVDEEDPNERRTGLARHDDPAAEDEDAEQGEEAEAGPADRDPDL
jgi:hypothetical protein